MAEVEHAPPEHGGGLEGLTRKVGPLPAWAWAALLLVGYFLYTRMKGSSTAGSSTTSSTGADMNPVPAATDQTDSGLGGGFGGGPTNIYNYYGQNPADTGGTGAGSGDGSGTGGTGGTPGGTGGNPSHGETPPPQGSGAPPPTSSPPGVVVSPPIFTAPIPHYFYNNPVAVNTALAPSAYTVPVSTQLGAGGSRASRVLGLV